MNGSRMARPLILSVRANSSIAELSDVRWNSHSHAMPTPASVSAVIRMLRPMGPRKLLMLVSLRPPPIRTSLRTGIQRRSARPSCACHLKWWNGAGSAGSTVSITQNSLPTGSAMTVHEPVCPYSSRVAPSSSRRRTSSA